MSYGIPAPHSAVGVVRFKKGRSACYFTAVILTAWKGLDRSMQHGRASSLPGASVYLEAAAKLRVRAAAAKFSEARAEFERLAALYERLAPLSAAPPFSSTWQGIPYNYNRETVTAIAPNAPGVYTLWSAARWIYVGECTDLQRRLLAHMEGDNEWITREAPKGFGFELIPNADKRVARQEALICELRPACDPLPD